MVLVKFSILKIDLLKHYPRIILTTPQGLLSGLNNRQREFVESGRNVLIYTPYHQGSFSNKSADLIHIPPKRHYE